MADLRCNTCVHLQQGYCNKLNEVVPDTLTKLFLGGAAAIYSGAVKYPSKCGIEKETELQIMVLNKPEISVVDH
jgi:hypothetical protein